MSDPQGVFLIGSTGALISPTNPLPSGLQNNGAGVNVNNPLSVVPGAVVQSLTAAGTATTPGAGSAFCSLANVPTGWYRIHGGVTLNGTAETTGKNVRLSLTTGGAIVDLPAATGVYCPIDIPAWLVSNNNDTLKLTAIAVGTTGAIYSGYLALERLA